MKTKNMSVPAVVLASCLAAGCASGRGKALPRPITLRLLPVESSVAVSSAALGSFQGYLARKLASNGDFALAASSASASACLHVDIVGYGKIKKSWMWSALAAGLGEGTVEGSLEGTAAALIAGPWAGVGIGMWEITEDTLLWGGGAFLFGKYLSPVVLESRLTRCDAKRPLWEKTTLAKRDGKALKAYPPARRKDPDFKLKLTARGAADKLVLALSKAARRKLRSLAGPAAPVPEQASAKKPGASPTL